MPEPEQASPATTVFYDHSEIHRRRWLKGLLQEDVATHAGISVGQFSHIERGIHVTNPATLRKIADALDCTIADLERRAS